VFDCGPHLVVPERRPGPSLDLLLKVAQPLDASANVVEAGWTFRNQPGDGFVMTGNHDLFASTDPVEELAEARLGFERGDFAHVDKSTNR
jgi:hypothetical protein